MAADNIVSLNRRKGGPDSELVESSATGEARLKELERLIQTAAEVQAQAESELSQTTASQSVAQQRKAAADSVRRKAEAEMSKLRTELAKKAEQNKPVWSPGDPRSDKRPDFEVSTLTGTASRGRFSDSAFMDSSLELDEDNTKVNSRINSTGGSSTRKKPKHKPATYKTKRSRSGWAIGLFVLLGVSAGAGFTWFSVQNPDAVGSQITAITNRVSSMVPVSVEIKTANSESAAAPKPATTASAPPPAKKPAANPAQVAQQSAQSKAAWQQSIALQEQRVRDAAAQRFKTRTTEQLPR